MISFCGQGPMIAQFCCTSMLGGKLWTCNTPRFQMPTGEEE